MFNAQAKAAFGLAALLLLGVAAAKADEGVMEGNGGRASPNPAHHWVIVQVTDAGSPATASIEFRRQGNVVASRSLLANSGRWVGIYSYPPDRRYKITCTYKGKTKTKYAYATKPPTYVNFHYANGQLN